MEDVIENAQAMIAARLSRGSALDLEGKRVDARIEWEVALNAARATPYQVEFQTRIQLVRMLADSYLGTGEKEQAQSLLNDEVAFASKIAEIMRAGGTPDQSRSANGGLTLLRDRAAQVALLGQDAPAIDIAEWVQGEPTTLTELRGRVTILEFWATWCKPCRESFPKLRRIHEQYSGRGLEVVALTRFYMSLGGSVEARIQELDLIRSTLAEHRLDFRAGVMEDERPQATYGANGLPTLVIIDRNGRVCWAGHSVEDIKLQAILEECLSANGLAY
ncbi:MAG: TlpA disulfide reductase family protein [Pyrinomonadaceae bacterium]